MRMGTQVLLHIGTEDPAATGVDGGPESRWPESLTVSLTEKCTCVHAVYMWCHLYIIYRTFKVLIQFLHFKNRDRNKRNSLESGNFWNFRNMENCLLWWLKSECVIDLPSKNILTIWVYPVVMFSTSTKTIIRFKLRFLDF